MTYCICLMRALHRQSLSTGVALRLFEVLKTKF